LTFWFSYNFNFPSMIVTDGKNSFKINCALCFASSKIQVSILTISASEHFISNPDICYLPLSLSISFYTLILRFSHKTFIYLSRILLWIFMHAYGTFKSFKDSHRVNEWASERAIVSKQNYVCVFECMWCF
jgi:hypothetical protein